MPTVNLLISIGTAGVLVEEGNAGFEGTVLRILFQPKPTGRKRKPFERPVWYFGRLRKFDHIRSLDRTLFRVREPSSWQLILCVPEVAVEYKYRGSRQLSRAGSGARGLYQSEYAGRLLWLCPRRQTRIIMALSTMQMS